MILFEDDAIFRICGRADALERAGTERGLEQIRRVERATRRRTGADDGVNLVDEQNRFRILDQLLQHRLQPLLEVAPILGACQQRAHVERVDGEILQQVRHVTFDDPARQAFRDSGLADTGFADEQRIVLAPAAQYLDDAFELVFATDERIGLADLGQVIEVHRVRVERTGGLRLAFAFFFRGLGLVRLLLFLLGDAVSDVVDNIETGDATLVQEIDGVRFLLAEDRDQHVGAGDFLLARRLHVQDRALDDALETLGRLRVRVGMGRQTRRVLVDEVGEDATQLVEIDAAGLQHLRCRRIVEHREQQVLDGDELMLLLPRLDKSHVEGNFEFLRNHDPSRLQSQRRRHGGAPAAPTLRFLHRTLQRMLMPSRKIQHLVDLRGGNLSGIRTANSHAFAMHLQHHLRRLFATHGKHSLQHHDDKVHRRVVVVEQNNLVERRGFELGLLDLENLPSRS